MDCRRRSWPRNARAHDNLYNLNPAKHANKHTVWLVSVHAIARLLRCPRCERNRSRLAASGRVCAGTGAQQRLEIARAKLSRLRSGGRARAHFHARARFCWRLLAAAAIVDCACGQCERSTVCVCARDERKISRQVDRKTATAATASVISTLQGYNRRRPCCFFSPIACEFAPNRACSHMCVCACTNAYEQVVQRLRVGADNARGGSCKWL